MTSVLKMFTAGFPKTESPERAWFFKKCAGGRMFFSSPGDGCRRRSGRECPAATGLQKGLKAYWGANPQPLKRVIFSDNLYFNLRLSTAGVRSIERRYPLEHAADGGSGSGPGQGVRQLLLSRLRRRSAAACHSCRSASVSGVRPGTGVGLPASSRATKVK
ncbi:hypothetical protein EDC14_104022 [Hydrogenispora ethanolica]|uniref:Uncharacterized protein n=1 Tax=Hydrogenispora ethanolica TaxID=1082276 RepID=A0A4R1R0L6_HYDET|nr:hypothetical protein EDC14_104022 [Hydrogenispora ethanolica]